MPRVVIYGAGGNGVEIAQLLQDAAAAGADWDLLGFLDDSPALQGARVLDLPVLGPGEWLRGRRDLHVALGLGHPRLRRALAQRLAAAALPLATVRHPTAVVSPTAQVGEGCVLFAGAVLSTRAHLGRGVQVGFHAVVHHDAQVGDWACLMAHSVLAGAAHLGEGAFLGLGATVRQQTAVGDWTLVGSGAAVVRDLPACCVALGVPARPSRHYPGPEQMPPL